MGRYAVPFRIGFLCIACLFLSHCTWPIQGRYQPMDTDEVVSEDRYHIVKKGETIWRIAQRYGVPLEDIVRYNNIDDVTKLPVGRRIYIPTQTALRYDDAPDFIWPLKGPVVRGFKRSGPINYSGIDILSPEGTPVKAAESGKVIYNGDHMSGYGNMIIIKHKKGFSSVYANNGVTLVKMGDMIDRGQIIAQVGKTGNGGEPYLHFEIRKEKNSLNPLLFLPHL